MRLLGSQEILLNRSEGLVRDCLFFRINDFLCGTMSEIEEVYKRIHVTVQENIDAHGCLVGRQRLAV